MYEIISETRMKMPKNIVQMNPINISNKVSYEVFEKHNRFRACVILVMLLFILQLII